MYSINEYIKDFSSEQEIKSELKKRLSEYFKCGFALPVSSGTTAIEVALKALDIKRGSCVIIPDISFIATATAVANCGLIPVYADISEEYFGLTLDAIKNKYNENVSAVIVVHFGGYVNREIFAIRDFCKNNNIYLLEDCAQAFSCSASGKKVGTIGDIGTYSLQSNKLVNCGEGGFILTDNEEVFKKCDMLSNWGHTIQFEDFDPYIPSSNFRLSAVQSYLVLKQLSMIEDIVSARLKRVSELADTCKTLGLDSKMPDKEDGFFDCPFHFPVKSTNKIHYLEPRIEYPMRKSNIVKAIYERFFPDLLEPYNKYNDASLSWSSNKLLQEVDFINILQQNGLSCTEILSPYCQKNV